MDDVRVRKNLVDRLFGLGSVEVLSTDVSDRSVVLPGIRKADVNVAGRLTMADDLGPFEELLSVLSKPYERQPGRERYEAPPRPEEVVHATFCGT